MTDEQTRDLTTTDGVIEATDPSNAASFVAAAGLRVERVSGTELTGHVDAGSDHHTPWGVVHGGLYATTIESATSIGASVAVRERAMFAVGLSNHTDFLRAPHAGTPRGARLGNPPGPNRTALAMRPHPPRRQARRPGPSPTAERAVVSCWTSPPRTARSA